MSSSLSICKTCNSENIVVIAGEDVCSACGSVNGYSLVPETGATFLSNGSAYKHYQFVAESEWDKTYSANDSVRRKLRVGRKSTERTILKAKKSMKLAAEKLKVPQYCAKAAFELYLKSLSKRLTQGRKKEMTYATCFVLTCRLQHTEHMVSDFSNFYQLNSIVLARTCSYFARRLNINLTVADETVIDEKLLRFASSLGLGAKTYKVYSTAIRIVKRLQPQSELTHMSVRLNSLYIAALFVALRYHGFVEKKKLIKLMTITEMRQQTLYTNVRRIFRQIMSNVHQPPDTSSVSSSNFLAHNIDVWLNNSSRTPADIALCAVDSERTASPVAGDNENNDYLDKVNGECDQFIGLSQNDLEPVSFDDITDEDIADYLVKDAARRDRKLNSWNSMFENDLERLRVRFKLQRLNSFKSDSSKPKKDQLKTASRKRSNGKDCAKQSSSQINYDVLNELQKEQEAWLDRRSVGDKLIPVDGTTVDDVASEEDEKLYNKSDDKINFFLNGVNSAEEEEDEDCSLDMCESVADLLRKHRIVSAEQESDGCDDDDNDYF